MAAAFGLFVAAVALPAEAIEIPVFGENVELLANLPDAAGISAAFDPNRPFMYLSSLHGIEVYDISSPELPILVGAVPTVMFQNENVNVGAASSRSDGTTFVLVGTDLGGAVTPTKPESTAVAPGEGGYVQRVYVVDVTDPRLPFIRSDLSPSTYTHTVTCVDKGCHYAYTAGTMKDFSVLDLRNLDRPKELTVVRSSWGWHDWQRDAAGIMWQAADHGTAAYDITDPRAPDILNTTNKLAVSGAQWNGFIHHNSDRPYARRFRAGRHPSVFAGNILLVTEEDLFYGDCSDFGSFQTWYIPSLRQGDNPTDAPGKGTIRPLDRWYAETFDTGRQESTGTVCSAHYFDFHQGGFVAQAWYSHGVRILDVRDAFNVKQVGYWVAPGQATWSAYWVPERDRRGRVVRGPHGEALRSEVVYAIDAGRGLDVLRVTLPRSSPTMTESIRAPLPVPSRAPDVASRMQLVCRIVTAPGR